jgi:hypothetical protein
MRDITNYREDYPAHEIIPAAEVFAREFLKSPVKFEGKTTYNKDFVPHDVEVEIKEAPVSRMKPGEFNG